MVHISIHELVSFLADNEITLNQYFFMYILYLAKFEERNDIKIYRKPYKGKHSIRASLYHWKRHASNMRNDGFTDFITGKDVSYLEERGLIVRAFPNKDNLNFDDCELTQEAERLMFLQETHYDRFWKAYPAQIKGSDGSIIALKGVDKDELWLLFHKKIKTPQVYEEMMTALVKMAKAGAIRVRIDKFLYSEAWKEDFLEERQAVDVIVG